MSTDPYKVSPGDLITATLFNGLQDKIKTDTADQIKHAIEGITKVQQAGDAGKLGGKTPEEFKKEILDEALAQIPKRSGYLRVFKRLETNTPEVVTHNLKAFPLVDAYQLDYFEVVCADHEDKENKFVNFYLYHSDEGEQKRVGTPPPKQKIIIESTKAGEYVFKIGFDQMLKDLGIDYSDPSQSIGDLVSKFWAKLFEPPSDTFDTDQYCNSEWFERCCGEHRPIGTLLQRHNWDNLRLKMVARKTINFPYPTVGMNTNAAEWPAVFPNNIEIVHLDFNNIGINLLNKPHYSKALLDADAKNDNNLNKEELKVMLLLKV
jgi:hypothetical protein